MSLFKIQVIVLSKQFRKCQMDLFENMRVGIRWQKYVKESLERRYDVKCSNIVKSNYDAEIYSMNCSSIVDFPFDWLKEGELVELLCTYDVLAVGKIIRD